MGTEEQTEQTPAAEAETAKTEETPAPEKPPSQSADDQLGELRQMITSGLGKIAKVLQAQQTQIDALRARPEAERAAPAESPRPRGLPDGVVRFRSRGKSFGIWMQPARRTIVDGNLHLDMGRYLEFVDGIFDTSEEDEIEFLRNRKGDMVGIGVDYFEDPFARPMPGPEVRSGPRTVGGSARTVGGSVTTKPAELAARV